MKAFISINHDYADRGVLVPLDLGIQRPERLEPPGIVYGESDSGRIYRDALGG